jgi:hypothetical protein
MKSEKRMKLEKRKKSKKRKKSGKEKYTNWRNIVLKIQKNLHNGRGRRLVAPALGGCPTTMHCPTAG